LKDALEEAVIEKGLMDKYKKVLEEGKLAKEVFDNIDDYAKIEWDEMEEKFTTDGDGDLIMFDELDDISYHKKDYILKNIFLEDNQDENMAKLDQDIRASEIQKHINMVLFKLPRPVQKVYELFTVHQFNIPEIAKIQNRTEVEINALLNAALKSLKLSILGRFGS